MPQIDEILANPATWSQYGPDVQAALANLSGNATQFPSRLSSSFQDPPGLSQSTIRGNGETAVAIDPQNRLSVLMDQQKPPQRQQQRLPENYIRNNSTGRVIDMGQSANGGQDVWQSGGEIIDEFQNLDGTITRRMKVPTHDGFGRQSSTIKDVIVTPDYLNPLKAKEMEYAKRQAELLSGQGRAIGDLGFEIDPGAARGMMNEMMSTLQKNMGGDANAALSNMSGLIRPKSGGIGQDLLTKRYGKAPDGSRWTPDGQLERIIGGQQDIAAQESAQTVTKNIDELIGQRDSEGKLIGDSKPHEGFYDAVGATWKPGAQYVPGTDASDFKARLEQLQGGAFLEAYKTLKGGGQITEVEGKKATAAITRMNLAQSEKEFVAAAQEFKSAVESGMRKLGVGMGGDEPRVTTQAEIQAIARKRGVPVSQIMAGARAKGYTVQ